MCTLFKMNKCVSLSVQSCMFLIMCRYLKEIQVRHNTNVSLYTLMSKSVLGHCLQRNITRVCTCLRENFLYRAVKQIPVIDFLISSFSRICHTEMFQIKQNLTLDKDNPGKCRMQFLNNLFKGIKLYNPTWPCVKR